MKEQSKTKTGYVKTQTMIGFVCLALVAGFFGGITLTIFKTGSGPPPAGPPGTGGQMPSNSDHIRALEEEVVRSPENVAAWRQLGNLYFDSDQYQKAIASYQQVLKREPQNADVRSDLGVMYRRNGQPEEAIKAFDLAMAADPGHETARFNKGIVLIHDLKDNENGLRAWEELVNLNPSAKAPNGQSVAELIRQYKERIDKSG